MKIFMALQVLAAVDHGLVPFFIVVILSVGFALWMRSLVVPPGDPHVTLADIEPLELSLLANPSDRLRFALTGMASLIGRGDGANKTDKLDPEAPFNLPPPPPAGAPPLLLSFYDRIAAVGAVPPVAALEVAMSMVDEVGESRLKRCGLVVDRWWATLAPWRVVAPLVGPIALGIILIGAGFVTGQVVAIVFFTCVTINVIGLRIAEAPRVTRQGEAVL